MYRNFRNVLNEWERNKVKEPLLISGARQVGKTWTIKEFCSESYSDYLYINFEERPEVASAFSESLSPAEIIKKISILSDRKITPDTALVFDEIQLCEEAITSLKYFCEAAENYRVICAGSLLGVKLKRFKGSFPVGKVVIKHMYPMDFGEFLIACDQIELKKMIEEHCLSSIPLADGIHLKALSLYHDYLIVGGMPRFVSEYVRNRDIMSLDFEILDSLRTAYLADMSKHVDNAAESLKITEVYNSVPHQLARDNPKFKYKEVRKNANKRDFYSSIDWLCASGLLLKVNNLDAVKIPLKGYVSDNSFKLYVSDCGLLARMSRIKYADLMPDSNNIYKGAVVENYVLSQFIASGKEVYYYKPSDSLEIDVIIDDPAGPVPCEIKSGRHKSFRSLKRYCAEHTPQKAIRMSELNFGHVDNLYSVPLYAAWCI